MDQVVKAEVNGAEHACVAVESPGRNALDVLKGIVEDCVSGLRAEKNMRWCDPKLSFSRAVRWLVALWGEQVVPARISEVVAGRSTYLQRTTAASVESRRRPDGVPVGFHDVASADGLLDLFAAGRIVLSSVERRKAVVEQAENLAASVGGVIDFEDNVALVDEITNLVEEPVGVLGSFDERYLELPDRILVSVMAKHQRYLPVRDAKGGLLPYFVTMANGVCDESVVVAGNESVLRARYEDALFFWNQDLEVDSVDVFVSGLEKLTFENRLGSVGQRARRIAAVATGLGKGLGLAPEQATTLERAGQLAKYDLATNLVTDMTSLAGFAAREYALRKGETPAVAEALYEMEQPHTSADAVPASLPGALLALGDRFDLLMAMFALGAKPSGSSDPYGLRRAALGVVRVLREVPGLTGIGVRDGLEAAAEALTTQGITVSQDAIVAAEEFVIGRYAQLMRDEGRSADMVAAVLPSAAHPADAETKANDLEALLGEPGWRAVVETVVRIHRILPAGTGAAFNPAVLVDDAEKALAEALVDRKPCESVSGFAASAKDLVDPIARFFNDTLVMAKEPELRAARLGLLASVAALAPAGLEWTAIDAVTK